MLADSIRSQTMEESWYDTWEDNRQTSFVLYRPAGFQHLVGVPPRPLTQIVAGEHADVPKNPGAGSRAPLPDLRGNSGGEESPSPTTRPAGRDDHGDTKGKYKHMPWLAETSPASPAFPLSSSLLVQLT